jgi:hypothetical protein
MRWLVAKLKSCVHYFPKLGFVHGPTYTRILAEPCGFHDDPVINHPPFDSMDIWLLDGHLGFPYRKRPWNLMPPLM